LYYLAGRGCWRWCCGVRCRGASALVPMLACRVRAAMLGMRCMLMLRAVLLLWSVRMLGR
jgi:hypothetical protein